jgi:hypothetical protein
MTLNRALKGWGIAMAREVIFAGVAGLALVLAGCAVTTSASDILNQGALEKSKTGVVILKAQILGHGCAGGTITIAKKQGAVYEPVRSLQTVAGPTIAANDVMSVELPPNEYHVVNVACSIQQGRALSSVSLGRREGGIVGLGGAYKKSFATFRIAAGEIVNLGSLTVMSGVLASVHLSVTDLPIPSAQRFAIEKPNLAKQMVTRLMVVNRVPMSPAERKQLCESYAVLKGILPGLGASPPSDCQGVPTLAASATGAVDPHSK